MIQVHIINEVENYVRRLLKEQLPPGLYFHNIDHTEMVVQGCLEIGQNMHLNERAIEDLQISAWFHDTGHIETYKGHEEISKKIALIFLTQIGYETERIVQVLDCIAVTESRHQPITTMEKVIRDADLYHLAGGRYFEFLDRLKKEREGILGEKISAAKWHRQNLEFLEHHSYHTSYGKKMLEKGKQVNLTKNWELILAEGNI